ncbi:MAG TPA: 2-hydroxyacid dehydrogenase, partial [Paracoccaceae bacterium]|nr:2-hydroxyacid dehydrogenase [Paracoccaceae bacterium]
YRYDEAANKNAFLAEFGPLCTAIVMNGHADLTRSMLEHLPKLEIVACSSAGYETIDVAALEERGIRLTNTSDALFDDVADLALLLVLATRRQLVHAHNYVVSGDWARKGMYPLLNSTKGKKLGIVGMGHIGQAIADRCEPLKVEIGYFGRTRKDHIPYQYFQDLVALAKWADIMVLAVAGGAGTKNLINAEVLKALGPEGTLVNVARGTVVDEPALIAALSSGELGSAGLDVFWNEPDPDPALTSLPNVTLYPHHASGTVETRDAMAQLVVLNLEAHFSGKPLLTPVL